MTRGVQVGTAIRCSSRVVRGFAPPQCASRSRRCSVHLAGAIDSGLPRRSDSSASSPLAPTPPRPRETLRQPLPPSRRFSPESAFHLRAAWSESTPQLEPTSVGLYHACSAKGVTGVILVPSFGHPGGLSRPASSASGGVRNAFPEHARPSRSRSGFRSPFAFLHLSTEGSSPLVISLHQEPRHWQKA